MAPSINVSSSQGNAFAAAYKAATSKPSGSSSSSAPAGSVGATYSDGKGSLLNSAGEKVGGAIANGGITNNGLTPIPSNVAISSDAIAPSTPVTVPAAPVATNQNGTLAGILTSLGLNADGTPVAKTAETKSDPNAPSSLADILTTELGLRTPPPNTADIYTKAYNEAGIAGKQNLVTSYTNQLNGITAKSQADQLSVTGQGRGIPEAIIGGQQAQISKEAAIQAIPVAAQLAAAQGDLQLAQSHLDTMYKLQVADAQATYNYKNSLIDSVVAYATKAEQRTFDQQKTDNANAFTTSRDNAAAQKDLAGKAIQYGQGDLVSQIYSVDPNSKTFSKDIAKIQAKINTGVTSSGIYIAGANPVVDGYITNVLNGNATLAQVPAAIRNAVSTGLAQQGTNSYSPLAASRLTLSSSRITDQFKQLPQYQLTANGLPYLQRIDAAMKVPGSVSDQDLLDSLTKLNTAGNAISDAQVRLITDGQSFGDMASTFAGKFKNGGVLSPNQRTQIQDIANAIFENYKKGYQPVYNQAVQQLTDAGIPKQFWTIPDLNNLSAQSGLGGAATQPTNTTLATGPDGQDYYVPNDQLNAFIAAGGKKK